jgi:hypothetical protein
VTSRRSECAGALGARHTFAQALSMPSSDEDEEGNEALGQEAMPSMPSPGPGNRLGRSQYSHNTGPKGVMADYKRACEALREKRVRDNVERWRKLERMAVGDPKAVQYVPAEAKQSRDAEPSSDVCGSMAGWISAVPLNRPLLVQESDSDSDDSELLDEQSFAAYRLQRLRVVQDSLSDPWLALQHLSF